MLSHNNIFDTIAMFDQQHLDIRTITMGISLLDCACEDTGRCAQRMYDKITKDLDIPFARIGALLPAVTDEQFAQLQPIYDVSARDIEEYIKGIL